VKIRTPDLLLIKHECYSPEGDVLLKKFIKNDLGHNTDVGILSYVHSKS
jgi:hypothetical protein